MRAMNDLREAVAQNRLWYHTLELAPDVVTPGWFDLRPIVDRLPWPDVRDKRCLDVGTYDGFLAFELERRGAAEVVATDISDHTSGTGHGPCAKGGRVPDLRGRSGQGPRIPHRARSSQLEGRQARDHIYDLSPEALGGQFDVVVCGSLMLHLKSPITAMERIRGMCRDGGALMSTEEIDPLWTLLSPAVRR